MIVHSGADIELQLTETIHGLVMGWGRRRRKRFKHA